MAPGAGSIERMRGDDNKDREIDLEAVKAAETAHLRYVNDLGPGIRRQRRGKSFRYLDVNGKRLRDPNQLRRIQSLVIPPAWTDVWICPVASGHLQATGHDTKHRKQYLYHPRWRQVRDGTKFHRMIAFGKILPRIRRRVRHDLRRRGLSREKVLATIVRLLETTHIRIGNQEYAKTNNSFGLTTMRNRHVEVAGSTVRFQFRGKGGKLHEIDIRSPRLARIVRRCQEIPGHELFQYLDENNERHVVDSGDVNEYLREITGEDFTAKDFRTWAGTVRAVRAFRDFPSFHSETHA